MITIPVFQTTSSDFIQKISLAGQLVTLRIKYNVRSFCFHLDFTDPVNNIVNGIKIVPNWPLLGCHLRTLDFVGDLMVIKLDDKAEKIITYDNFGIGWGLVYLTDDEMVAWRSDNGL